MEIDYNTVNLTIHPAERESVEKQLERVSTTLSTFSGLTAHIEIERSLRKGGIGVSLFVKLPTRSLFATAWGSDVRSATELATDKVVRQARKHLDLLRKEERAGSDSVRTSEPYRPVTVEDLAQVRDSEDFRDHVADHAARLHKVLLRERRLDPRVKAAGGLVSLPDIVEEALAYVFGHFREKPPHMSPDRWLVRRGLLILDEELSRIEREPTGGTPEPHAEEEREDWEDLMDLPVFEATAMDAHAAEEGRAAPDVIGDRHEAQRETAAALKALPERQRKAIVLKHLEGYALPEIAYVLNAEEATVESWLAEAEVKLKNRLQTWRPS